MLKKLILILLLPALCFGQDSATGTQPEVNELEQVLLHAPKTYETGFTDAHKTFLPPKWITLPLSYYLGTLIHNPFPDKKSFIDELVIEGIKNQSDTMVQVEVHLYALDTVSQTVTNVLSNKLLIKVPKGNNDLRITISDREIEFPKGGMIFTLKPLDESRVVHLRLGKINGPNPAWYYGIRENDPYARRLKTGNEGFAPMIGFSIKQY